VIIQDQFLESLRGCLEQVNARKIMVGNFKFGKKIDNEVFFLHTSKHNNNLRKYNQLKRRDNIN
jgi:FAD synthase